MHSHIVLARTIHVQVYTVYIRNFKQGNHHTYGHIQCRYTVLANPTYILAAVFSREITIYNIYGHIQCRYTVLANPTYILAANILVANILVAYTPSANVLATDILASDILVVCPSSKSLFRSHIGYIAMYPYLTLL